MKENPPRVPPLGGAVFSSPLLLALLLCCKQPAIFRRLAAFGGGGGGGGGIISFVRAAGSGSTVNCRLWDCCCCCCFGVTDNYRYYRVTAAATAASAPSCGRVSRSRLRIEINCRMHPDLQAFFCIHFAQAEGGWLFLFFEDEASFYLSSRLFFATVFLVALVTNGGN